jgi:rare lipoprotein A
MNHIRTAKAFAFASSLCLGLSAMTAIAHADQSGKASWYSLPGKRTACGQKMNPNAMIAAHRSLPCGTRLKVTNHGNGQSVVVTVADRGPFVRGRIVDVSRGAAQSLGFVGAGTASVSISPLGSRAQAEPIDEFDMADATPTPVSRNANGVKVLPFDPLLIR